MRRIQMLIVTLFILAFCLTIALGQPKMSKHPDWNFVYNTATTGDCDENSCGKWYEGKEGTKFFFGYSPVDNSLGIIVYVPGQPGVGVCAKLIDGEIVEPRLLTVIVSIQYYQCELSKANEMLAKFLKMYREKCTEKSALPI